MGTLCKESYHKMKQNCEGLNEPEVIRSFNEVIYEYSELRKFLETHPLESKYFRQSEKDIAFASISKIHDSSCELASKARQFPCYNFVFCYSVDEITSLFAKIMQVFHFKTIGTADDTFRVFLIRTYSNIDKKLESLIDRFNEIANKNNESGR
jgi:hypothetical protein